MTKNLELWQLIEETQGKIAAEIRRMLNEPAIDPVNFTPENQRRRVEALIQASGSTSDEERHTEWVRKHESEGWTLSEVFDAALKTHPNLVPWDRLPRYVKSKARIFDLMSKLGKELESFLIVPDVPPAAVPVDQDKETQIPPDLV